MESINFSYRISERIKSKSEDIYALEHGIMKALLEKYKPKVLCDIETLREEKAHRRVV